MNVKLERPDHEALSGMSGSAVDMHFHTKYSDTYTKIPNLLKRAKALGIGLAVTDHNEVKGSVLASRSAKGTLVIPGMEVSTFEGPHILTYFANINDLAEFFIQNVKDLRERNHYANTKVRIETMMDAAEKYDCIVCAAHPSIPAMDGICRAMKLGYVKPEIFERLKAIEVINGSNPAILNKRSIKLARTHDKCFTGGSDGHTLAALGAVVTVADAQTPADFLEAIRKKENAVIGKSTKLIPNLTSFTKSLVYHLQHAPTYARAKAKRAKDLSMKQRLQPAYQEKVEPVIKRTVSRIKKAPAQMRDKVRRSKKE